MMSDVDSIGRMAAMAAEAWRARRTGGAPGPGDLVREAGVGVELTVGRVDDSVEPAAAWCGMGGGEDFWGCRWIPVDRLRVVRKAGDPDAPRDDAGDALADAIDVALEVGEAHLGAALILLLRLHQDGRAASAFEELGYLAADAGIGPEG